MKMIYVRLNVVNENVTNACPVLVQISKYFFQRLCFVRLDGNSFTSILLKPGTHRGRRRACSSAIFLMNLTTRSTVSVDIALLGNVFKFPWVRKVNPFFL